MFSLTLVYCLSFAVGQAVASRLGQQISRLTKKVKKELSIYNEMSHCQPTECLPAALTLEEVLSPDAAVFNQVGSSSSSVRAAGIHSLGLQCNQVSSKIKRDLVSAFHKRKRAEEEMGLVVDDMKASLMYLQQQHALVSAAIRTVLEEEGIGIPLDGQLDFTQISRLGPPSGVIAFHFQKLLKLEFEFLRLKDMFELEITDIFLPCHHFWNTKAMTSEPEVFLDSADVEALCEELDCDTHDVQQALEALCHFEETDTNM
jgi:hypothetical protein